MADRQGVIDDIRITCAVCGEYHSIFTGCHTDFVPDIPLDQAVEMIKDIASKQRAGLIAAGVLVDESDGNRIALR